MPFKARAVLALSGVCASLKVCGLRKESPYAVGQWASGPAQTQAKAIGMGDGRVTGLAWLDVLPVSDAQMVRDAAAWIDSKGRVQDPRASWWAAIASDSSEEGKALFAQYFTPPDVALSMALSLPLTGNVLDPSAGKGSLLIAAGIAMGERGVVGAALLDRLHGIEIDPETRLACIEAVATALAPWHNMEVEQAQERLSRTIALGDALVLPWPKGTEILTNPPYKEVAGRNLWMAFLEKALDSDPMAVAAIVPVSLVSSKRAGSLRQALAAFPVKRLFHHEIRPRALFPGVEQRITLAVLRKDGAPVWETTGFLTHRAGERGQIWDAPMVSLDIPSSEVSGFWPKVSPETIGFFWRQQNGETFADIRAKDDGDPMDLWLRISGRYSLLAQREAPAEITSKWKRHRMGPHAARLCLDAFASNEALLWWKMYGDGRDFPIKAFFENWRPVHGARQARA